MDAIKDFWDEHKYSPAYEDIVLVIVHPISTVQVAIHNLKKFGLITQDRGVSRSIVITDDGRDFFKKAA